MSGVAESVLRGAGWPGKGCTLYFLDDSVIGGMSGTPHLLWEVYTMSCKLDERMTAVGMADAPVMLVTG